MSKHSHFCLLLIITFCLVILPLVAHGFATSLNDEEAIEVGVHLMKEKLTHLRLYWHDVVSGPSPTSVRVVKPVSSKSETAFGLVNMIDNALTQGPNINTKLVGRAQGLYASACQNDIGLLMAMNFAFMEGQYNGSSITILGRNMVFSKVREMAVVGGSGLFRFATGYVEARTHALNPNTGDAIVQYDCYVKHY